MNSYTKKGSRDGKTVESIFDTTRDCCDKQKGDTRALPDVSIRKMQQDAEKKATQDWLNNFSKK